MIRFFNRLLLGFGILLLCAAAMRAAPSHKDSVDGSQLRAAQSSEPGGILRLAQERAVAEDKRLQAAKKQVEAHPEHFSPETKENILAGRITVGMSPYESQLAGGAFFYKVEADPKVWPPGSNPLAVIDRQTNRPDDSKITLTFRNTTQYSTAEPRAFRVEFQRGRVATITPEN